MITRLLTQVGFIKMHNYWKRVNYNTEVNIRRHGVHGFLGFPELQATMIVTDENRAKEQLEYIKEMGFYDHEELLKDNVLPENHPQKVQCLYHLYRFIESGGKIPARGRIVEVGPGIGCMPLLIKKMGFKGVYHIIDSETINKIQTYYLTENNEFDNVEFIGPKSNKIDILIGTWSISEMPLKDRREADYDAKQYLLAYGDLFNGELDNREFFSDFKDIRSSTNWVELPVFGDQKYLFGFKKEKKNETTKSSNNTRTPKVD